MPGSPVGLAGLAQRIGQGPVRGDPPDERGALVGGVPDQRVPEPQRLPGQQEEPGALGRFQVLDRGAEPPAALNTTVRSPVSSAAATNSTT